MSFDHRADVPKLKRVPRFESYSLWWLLDQRAPAPVFGLLERPEELRLNSYRVLLSRGRDAMILYMPEQPALDATFKLLTSLGLTEFG